MVQSLNCNSCNIKIINLTGSVTFKCPKCNEFEITRCTHCRKVVAKYKCPKCNFVGP